MGESIQHSGIMCDWIHQLHIGHQSGGGGARCCLMTTVWSPTRRRLPRDGLRPLRASDQELASRPISRTTRDKRLRRPSFQDPESAGRADVPGQSITSSATPALRTFGRGPSDGAEPRHAGIVASVGRPPWGPAARPRGRENDTVTCFVTLADCWWCISSCDTRARPTRTKRMMM